MIKTHSASLRCAILLYTEKRVSQGFRARGNTASGTGFQSCSNSFDSERSTQSERPRALTFETKFPTAGVTVARRVSSVVCK